MKTILWIERELVNAERMIMEGRVEEGLRMLNNLLYEEPGYGPLHNYLGWAYMYHANDARMAEMHFSVAMRFAPEYAPPYLHMGNLLNREGRYAEAIRYFSAGMTCPNAVRISLLEGIAEAHEMRGEYRDAIRAYKEAAATSVIDFEVERLLKSAGRCRKKRMAMLFSFW
jgi:tetratricopeptide (TPR) repeat protein